MVQKSVCQSLCNPSPLLTAWVPLLSRSLRGAMIPSLTTTKTFSVSFYLLFAQRSKSFCLRLLSPYFCHLSVCNGVLCFLWCFLLFLIFYLLPISFISLSVPGPTDALHNHFTSFHFVLDAGIWRVRVNGRFGSVEPKFSVMKGLK